MQLCTIKLTENQSTKALHSTHLLNCRNNELTLITATPTNEICRRQAKFADLAARYNAQSRYGLLDEVDTIS